MKFKSTLYMLTSIGCVAADSSKLLARTATTRSAKRLRQATERSTLRAKRFSDPTNVALTDWVESSDLQWFATIQVGTPPQNFTVLLDTGSTDLLLPRSICTTCGTHTLFDPDKSSSFSALPGDPITQTFGTGGNTVPLSQPEGASGSIATDVVSLNGLTAQSQQFLLCDVYAEVLNLQPIDGILGLGPTNFSRLSGGQNGNSSNTTVEPFFSQIVSSGQAEGMFAFQLNSGNATLGELTLGGVDASKFQGDITYVPLNAEAVALAHEWVVEQPVMYVYGAPVANGTGVSILDTGTAYITTPDGPTSEALYAQISPNITRIDTTGVWGAPCSLLNTLKPTLTFTFGSLTNTSVTPVNLTVPSSAFNLGEYPGQPGICQTLFLDPAEVLEFGVPVWVVGSPLLKAYYTVWDSTNLRFGVASLKASNTSGTASGTASGTPSTTAVSAAGRSSTSKGRLEMAAVTILLAASFLFNQ